MKAYCLNCGALMEFKSGEKPKFCGACGADTKTGKVPPPRDIHGNVIIKATKPKVEKVNLEDEEEPAVPEIDKLDFDVKGSLEVKKTSINDLISTSDGSNSSLVRTNIKSSSPEQNKEQFMEQFQKEAGSLKKGG
tara:strand:+ start:312 stop:716 length:405 start_codon:yes stop_codon:yes gene_type:complete